MNQNSTGREPAVPPYDERKDPYKSLDVSPDILSKLLQIRDGKTPDRLSVYDLLEIYGQLDAIAEANLGVYDTDLEEHLDRIGKDKFESVVFVRQKMEAEEAMWEERIKATQAMRDECRRKAEWLSQAITRLLPLVGKVNEKTGMPNAVLSDGMKVRLQRHAKDKVWWPKEFKKRQDKGAEIVVDDANNCIHINPVMNDEWTLPVRPELTKCSIKFEIDDEKVRQHASSGGKIPEGVLITPNIYPVVWTAKAKKKEE